MNIDMTEKQKDQANRLYLDRKKTIAELADMYQVSAAEIMAALRERKKGSETVPKL